MVPEQHKEFLVVTFGPTVPVRANKTNCEQVHRTSIADRLVYSKRRINFIYGFPDNRTPLINGAEFFALHCK